MVSMALYTFLTGDAVRAAVANILLETLCGIRAYLCSYLMVMAQALEIELNELGPVSLKHKKSVVISSMCTVFAESEVVSLIAEGYAKEDILNGLHRAIASRVSAMAQSLRVENVVMLGGGVAKNAGVVKALEQNLKVKVKVPSEPQIIAALGAAICAQEMADR